MPKTVPESMTAAEARHQEFMAMPEAELQQEVIELARIYGWLAHAERPARTGRTYLGTDGVLKESWVTHIQGDKGYLDLLLVRRWYVAPGPHMPGRCIIAELKRQGEDPTPEQEIWIEAGRLCTGLRVCLWRPEDLESGAIEAALR